MFNKTIIPIKDKINYSVKLQMHSYLPLTTFQDYEIFLASQQHSSHHAAKLFILC